MIIGDIRTFAIEVEITAITDHIFGKCRFWLGGRFLGAMEDINILGVPLHALNRLESRPERVEFDKLDAHTAGDFLSVLRDDDRLRNRCLVSFGEGFDDFLVFAFRHRDQVWFIWQLHKKPFFEYPGYGRAKHIAAVDGALFSEVLDGFRRLFEEPVSNDG